MTRVPTQTPRGPGVFHELALRIRRAAVEEQANTGTGVERFTVQLVNPFTLAELGGTLVLEDGDPDFTMGETLRARVSSSSVAVGDLVWCARQGSEWHAFDVVSR